MSQTAPPSMTAPPSPAPDRDDPTNFAARGDATLGYITDTMVGDVTAAMGNVYNNAVDCYNNAVAAAASSTSASGYSTASAASAVTAAAAAGASIWVSGTTYAIGDVRWSPANRYSYRRITAGAGTTDPNADATNWALAGVAAPQLVIVSSTPRNMSANEHAHITNAAATTCNLPSSPTVGDVCWISVGNSRFDNVVGANTKKIRGVVDDMTITGVNETLRLRYVDTTTGWKDI